MHSQGVPSSSSVAPIATTTASSSRRLIAANIIDAKDKQDIHDYQTIINSKSGKYFYYYYDYVAALCRYEDVNHVHVA